MYNLYHLVRIKRKITPFLFLLKPIFGLFLIGLILLFSLNVVLPRFTSKNYFLKILQSIGKTSGVLKEDNGVVNILVMGVGGENHEGNYLTDSLILVNLNIKTKKILLVSIPRDLWINELGDKINTAYEKGRAKNKETGIILAKATVSEVTGVDVHYGAVVDFQAFAKIVDAIDGVDVNIERTFDDFQYPIEDKENDLCGKNPDDIANIDITEQNIATVFPCRYQHVHFDKGVTHLNGDLALKYVRSRHATGEEGTDFARSKRQLNLISAIRAKITKPEVYLNPQTIMKLSSDLKNDIESDLLTEQIIYLGKSFMQTSMSDVKTMTIDWGNQQNSGLLINPPTQDYNGVWVLVPRTGNWQEIHDKVKSFLHQQ